MCVLKKYVFKRIPKNKDMNRKINVCFFLQNSQRIEEIRGFHKFQVDAKSGILEEVRLKQRRDLILNTEQRITWLVRSPD